jgi:hypothetical protein
MKLFAGDYERGLLTWQPTVGLTIRIGTAAGPGDEMHWSEALTNPQGSLIGIRLGAVVTLQLQGTELLEPTFWIKLECIQDDVVYTRIWHGVPNGKPVIFTHVPGYGYYHRLVLDAGTLAWDADLVFRRDGVLVRFVTGNVQGEASGGLKPTTTVDGKIALIGSQETVTASGRFIEVVTLGDSPDQAELHAHSLLGLLALALGQNVLRRIVFSEPWFTELEKQTGVGTVLGSEVPRQAGADEFDQLDPLFGELVKNGQVERARLISLRWYQRGFRAREPLDMLLSFYIGVESLVAAVSKETAPLPVEQQRSEENQAILTQIATLGKAVVARVSQRIRGASIREQFEHYAKNRGLGEAELTTFAKIKKLRDDAVHGDPVDISSETAREAERLLRTMLKSEFQVTQELPWERNQVIYSLSVEFNLHTK